MQGLWRFENIDSFFTRTGTLPRELHSLLDGVHLPRMALVRQDIQSPDPIEDIPRALQDALRDIQLPTGSVAVGVGSRGVGIIGEIVAAVVQALRSAGAHPFIVPAMGSHGASTAEGQARVLAHLGVSEATTGAPVKATMETVRVGVTPHGVPVYVDRFAYAADAIVVVNRVKPHSAFRGPIESGPMKMLAVGLGKWSGAEAIHMGGFGEVGRNVIEAARVLLGTGKVAFGVGVLEAPSGEPYKLVAFPSATLEVGERKLLQEARDAMSRLPFDDLDVLVMDEIGKDISGDGADPSVTGRWPTPFASGGPSIERLVALDLTEGSDGNANGVGLMDVITERLLKKIDFTAMYTNALTSRVIGVVRIPMTMPTDELAIRAAVQTCAGLDPARARIVRVRNTLKMSELWVSESLLTELEGKPGVAYLNEPAAG